MTDPVLTTPSTMNFVEMRSEIRLVKYLVERFTMEYI